MNVTFKQLWLSLKQTWQSRPFAILLPIGALVWFWYQHGHILALATVGNGGSLPTWPDLVAGIALLATKAERFTELVFGAPAPAVLPPPVQSPLLAKGPGDPPKVVGFILLFGLALTLHACSLFQKKVSAIEADIKSCVTTDGPQSLKDIENAAVPFLEQAFMCDAESGFDPNAIPACLLASLSGVEAQVGPDAKRFEQCLVTTIENDPAAAKPVKQRARLVNVKLALGR